MMGGLEPMQLMEVRQVIGEQVGQARGVPEMFGQRPQMGFLKVWIQCTYQEHPGNT